MKHGIVKNILVALISLASICAIILASLTAANVIDLNAIIQGILGQYDDISMDFGDTTGFPFSGLDDGEQGELLFTYTSDYPGVIYFKNNTGCTFYPDGNGGFNSDASYSSKDLEYSPASYYYQKAKNSNQTSYSVTVSNKKTRKYALVPDYCDGSSFLQCSASDDSSYEPSNKLYNYEASFIPEFSQSDAQFSSSFTGKLKDEFDDYQAYVYDTYLSVPAKVKDGILEFMDANGLNDPGVGVEEIKNFFATNFTYGTTVDICPSGTPAILFFLNTLKTGLCHDFAGASVLMYRLKGIPARFVTGYYQANTNPNSLMEVYSGDKTCHAWTEVFVQESGWMRIDATPGGSNPSDDSGIVVAPGIPDETLGDDINQFIDSDSGDVYIKNPEGSWEETGNIYDEYDGNKNGDVLSGNGLPSSDLGQDGDFYVDLGTGTIYEKTDGSWNDVGNIGTDFPIGGNGNNGNKTEGPGGSGGPGREGSTGELSGENSQPETTEAFEVYSNLDTQNLYLKAYSYGDYTGKGFNAAPNYYDDNTPETNPQTYLFDKLANNGYLTQNLWINNNQTGLLLSPYYSEECDSGNDYSFGYSDGLFYTVNYKQFDYADYSGLTSGFSTSSLEAAEMDYLDYVLDNYLKIGASTKEGLILYGNEHGIDSHSSTLVTDIVSLIRNSAIYNLNYDYQKYSDSDDDVLTFLNDSKEGVCRQFAMACTMMMRAYEIPARYTTGYYVSGVKSGVSCSVTNDKGHAWTEAYIKGTGWVQVDATASNGIPSGDDIEEDNRHLPLVDKKGLLSPDTATGDAVNLFTYDDVSNQLEYFKFNSGAEYTGKGFLPEENSYNDAEYSVNPQQFASDSISSLYQDKYLKTIDVVASKEIEGIPDYSLYYPEIVDSSREDTFDFVSAENRSISYYDFNYYSAATAGDAFANDSNNPDKNRYSQFIRSNTKYLKVPSSTETGLSELVVRLGIDRQSQSLVTDIAQTINKLPQRISDNQQESIFENSDDVVLKYLGSSAKSDNKKAAMSAVMMYRYLGYPARYVQGYVSPETTIGKNVRITTSNESGWAEVYLDDLGWVIIDPVNLETVTNSVNISHITPSIDFTYDAQKHKFIDLVQIDCSLTTSDGQIYSNNGRSFDNGWHFELTSESSFANHEFINAGTRTSKFIVNGFKLFDSEGNELPCKSNISTYSNLSISSCVISQMSSEVITRDIAVTSDMLTDGSFTCGNDNDSYIPQIEGLQGEDYLAHWSYSASISSTGKVLNSVKVTIVNKDGEDVTDNYDFTYTNGYLIME
ncbi:MAG: transglutaminase-like domain-containing protein [Bacilli bacterium]